MSLVVEDLFWWFPVFFVDSCSADSCDFRVLVRGGELKIFLLCHLGQSPKQFISLPCEIDAENSASVHQYGIESWRQSFG